MTVRVRSVPPHVSVRSPTVREGAIEIGALAYARASDTHASVAKSDQGTCLLSREFRSSKSHLAHQSNLLKDGVRSPTVRQGSIEGAALADARASDTEDNSIILKKGENGC